MGVAHLTGVEGIVIQGNRIAHLIEEHVDLWTASAFSKIGESFVLARDSSIEFYRRIEGNLATRIGKSVSV